MGVASHWHRYCGGRGLKSLGTPDLEKCALLKCLCGSAFAAGQAPVRSLALKISVIFGHTDKSSLIHLSNL